MTKEQIKELYNKMAKEADVFTRLTLDKDELQDFYIDNHNQIYLCDHLTPYTTSDVKLIKYRINRDGSEITGNSVMMLFNNGDAIRINNISIDAIINYQIYEDYDVFMQYNTMVHKTKDVSIPFQTWNDVVNQLRVCFEKAYIFGFDLQQNDHTFADIYFDNKTLYIANSIETPYKINDIISIKYHVPIDTQDIDNSYVCIRFQNGEVLELKDYEDYRAGVRTGKRFLCFLDSIKTIAQRYALKIKAIENQSQDNEFVIVDNTLIEYNGEDQNIIIPEGVEIIEQNVFHLNDMKSVVFPTTLKRICRGCFEMCDNLEQVTMNNGLEVIEEEAFLLCHELKEITFPKSLKRIESKAFVCTHIYIDDVSIPHNCEVENDAFGDAL